MSIKQATFSGSQALTTAFASVTLAVPAVATGPIALGGLWLYLTTLVTAATLTVRITRDAVGDELVCPDFDAEIDVGATTATDGSCIIDYDRIPFYGTSGVTSLYVWAKTNAGTITLTEAKLTLVTG